VGGPAAEVDPAPAATATATADPEVRIPGSTGRPYNPHQRTSLERNASRASVAAEILAATSGTPEQAPTLPTTPVAPAPALAFGAPPAAKEGAPDNSPTGPVQVAGRTFAAPADPQDPADRSAAHSQAHSRSRKQSLRIATSQQTATPASNTSEISRPRPAPAAPDRAAATTAPTTARRPTVSARWLPDPTGRHQFRFWDGGGWTQHVYDAAVDSRDADDDD